MWMSCIIRNKEVFSPIWFATAIVWQNGNEGMFVLCNVFTPTRKALDQWFSNFHEPWPIQKVPNISWHLGYAISLQSYLVEVSARGPPENRSVASKEEPRTRLRNSALDFKHASQLEGTHKSIKEDEDIYLAEVENIHLMVLIHLLWWNTSL